MSFVQVESSVSMYYLSRLNQFFQSRSSFPAEVILQDLTASITKTGEFPVARGGFGEVWKCIYQTHGGPTDVRGIICMHLSKVEVLQVAVKALLVYASDQFSEGMEKKTKVSISMKVFTCELRYRFLFAANKT